MDAPKAREDEDGHDDACTPGPPAKCNIFSSPENLYDGGGGNHEKM